MRVVSWAHVWLRRAVVRGRRVVWLCALVAVPQRRAAINVRVLTQPSQALAC